MIDPKYSFCWILYFLVGNTVTFGQQFTTLDLARAEQQAFRKAVESVAQCVVQIEVFGVQDKADGVASGEGVTTGVVIEAEGWILTSLYSFKQTPASILVSVPGETSRLPARLVSRDFSREVALLKVEPSQALSAVDIAKTEDVQVGQWCIAVGKTYDSRSVTQSVGIVSAKGRAYGRAIQTDAKVSPINYGGPLIDLQGRVIGVLTPIAAAEMLEEDPSMLYDSGIGFAIPLQDLVKRLDKMKQGNEIRPGKLGIVSKTQNELAGPVRLSGAAPGTPAAQAGAKPGDVIISANDRPVELLADLRAALAQVDAGESLRFTVQRKDQRIDLQCDLVADVPVYRRRFLGIRPQKADQGVLIASIVGGSPAERAGLKPGQLITHCNGQPLKSVDELTTTLAVAELKVPIELRVTSSAAEDLTVQVLPETWPTTLIQDEPSKLLYRGQSEALDPSQVAQVTQLKLADLPNQIHVLIPPQAADFQLGCLLLFPEPGPVDLEQFKASWQEFARDFGWVVVAPTSTNPQAWSKDEALELPERLMARLSQEYQLDRSRSVCAGIGIGGQLALRAALGSKNQFAAVMTVATPVRGIPMVRPSMPMETLDFLLIGPKLEALTEQLNSVGFVANSIDSPGLDPGKWSSWPQSQILKWLESLGCI